MSKKNIVAILDAGSQYGKLIDKKIRALQVSSDILGLDTPIEKLKDYGAIVISGGPNSVYAKGSLKCDKKIFTELAPKIPVLGICYGFQLVNYFFGGKVEKTKEREDGQLEIKLKTETDSYKESELFHGINKDTIKVLLTHGDSVVKIPDDYVITSRSELCIASIENKAKKIYCTQFHPEVDISEHGNTMLSNFLFRVAGLKGDFTMDNRIDSLLKEIKDTVGEKKVIVLLSGGVDSSVCLSLCTKALDPKKVIAIHIDHGFMRQGESANVKKMFAEKLGKDITVLNVEKEFANGFTVLKGKTTTLLKNTEQPEIKRKIIGDTFMKIIDREINKLKLTNYYLCQGTLRPDLIESASSLVSSNAETIKTHHNDTQMVKEKREQGLILEPLKDYHKDEVRIIGRTLGLPESFVERHPFPGPGLAIRTLCATSEFKKPDYSETNIKLKKLFEDKKSGIEINLLPIKSVGVQGDGRSYSYVAAISTKNKKPDWETIFKMARKIPNKIHNINRIVFIFGQLDNTSPKITKTFLSQSVCDQLRRADDKVNIILKAKGLMKKLSQVPVILVPVNFDDKTKENNKRSIVIRTIITNDFMTGQVAEIGNDVSEKDVMQMVNEIKKDKSISRVMYDLTCKPPATTEWE